MAAPNEFDPKQVWVNYLAMLKGHDQRKPFVAMQVRRTQQHLDKIEERERNEREKNQSIAPGNEELGSTKP